MQDLEILQSLYVFDHTMINIINFYKLITKLKKRQGRLKYYKI